MNDRRPLDRERYNFLVLNVTSAYDRWFGFFFPFFFFFFFFFFFCSSSVRFFCPYFLLSSPMNITQVMLVPVLGRG